MVDSRKARRRSDPGLQPERTALAWLRTLPGYGALLALAIRHNLQQTGLSFCISGGVLFIAAAILWRYSRRRGAMAIGQDDFSLLRPLRDKLLLSLTLLYFSLLFSVAPLRQLIQVISDRTG